MRRLLQISLLGEIMKEKTQQEVEGEENNPEEKSKGSLPLQLIESDQPERGPIESSCEDSTSLSCPPQEHIPTEPVVSPIDISSKDVNDDDASFFEVASASSSDPSIQSRGKDSVAQDYVEDSYDSDSEVLVESANAIIDEVEMGHDNNSDTLNETQNSYHVDEADVPDHYLAHASKKTHEPSLFEDASVFLGYSSEYNTHTGLHFGDLSQLLIEKDYASGRSECEQVEEDYDQLVKSVLGLPDRSSFMGTSQNSIGNESTSSSFSSVAPIQPAHLEAATRENHYSIVLKRRIDRPVLESKTSAISIFDPDALRSHLHEDCLTSSILSQLCLGKLLNDGAPPERDNFQQPDQALLRPSTGPTSNIGIPLAWPAKSSQYKTSNSSSISPLNGVYSSHSKNQTHSKERGSRIGESSDIDVSSFVNPFYGEISCSSRCASANISADMSLGMKLSLIGGQVIVQSLSPLKDGRASPAQLSSIIRVGDVLYSIDGKSLRGLDITQLSLALQPLKAGSQFQPQASKDKHNTVPSSSSSVFSIPIGPSLAPYEDDMSIASSISKQTQHSYASRASRAQPANTPVPPNRTKATISETGKMEVSLQFMIGSGLESLLIDAKNTAEGALFSPFAQLTGMAVDSLSGMPMLLPFADLGINSANDAPTNKASSSTTHTGKTQEPLPRLIEVSGAIPPSTSILPAETNASNMEILTSPGRLSRSMPYVPPKQRLALVAEFVSLGREIETKQWYSGFFPDLYLRRRNNTSGNQDEAGEKVNSKILATNRKLNHEEDYVLWAKSVYELIEKLDKIRIKQTDESQHDQTVSDSQDQTMNRWKKRILDLVKQNLDNKQNGIAQKENFQSPEALTSIEGFLLGANVTEMLKAKSNALPDAELTRTLFHETDKIVSGSAFDVMTSRQVREKRSFLLNSALPMWLGAFTPLQWHYRRVLWPFVESDNLNLEETSSLESISVGASTTSLSMFSNTTKSPATKTFSKKSLESVVEELELQGENKIYTCFLVTYYFVNMLESMSEKEAHKFVTAYGTYLDLSESLVAAAECKAKNTIDILLRMASKYDVRHKKAVQEFSCIIDNTPKAVRIGEQPLLSVLIQLLNESSFETNKILPFLVSAFPDLKPWQVCMAAGKSQKGKENYYEYLSTLLDPLYGDPSARQDKGLVQEWCELSAESLAPDMRANYYAVARASNLTYFRDLPLLVALSMSINDHSMAITLAQESLRDPVYLMDEKLQKKMLDTVLQIIHTSLRSISIDSVLLASALEYLNSVSIHEIMTDDKFNLPKELVNFFSSVSDSEDKTELLLKSVTRCFSPYNVTEVLKETPYLKTKCITKALRKTLVRAARQDLNCSLSAALFRVRQSRANAPREVQSAFKESDDDLSNESLQTSIWDIVRDGSA